MAWSGSNFVRALGATQWANDAAANVGIEAAIHDTQDNDLATGIDNCINKNGANTPTANLGMGGYKHTNVANASAGTEYMAFGQISNGTTTVNVGSITATSANVSGQVGIGTTTPNAKCSIKFDTSEDDFAVGRAITGANYVVSQNIYDKTTVLAANVAVESTAGSYPIRRSTSSIKYKQEIVDLDPAYADKLHQFRPVFFKSKCFGDNPQWTHYGFIAEELAEIEPRFVSFGYRPDDYEEYTFIDSQGKEHIAKRLKADAKAEPEGVNYDRIVTFLTSIIQRQEKRLKTLENRIAALE